MGAHFVQAADGALEHPGQALAGVQILGPYLGGGDQLDVAVVELVHQRHEPPGPVVVALVQGRNPSDQDRLELSGDLDVIRRAARPVADRMEIEPHDAVGAADGPDRPPFDLEHDIRLATVRRDVFEILAQHRAGIFIQRAVINLRVVEIPQAVIDAGIDLHDVGVLFDQVDRRQEPVPLQAARV